jgi:hypothetical protein
MPHNHDPAIHPGAVPAGLLSLEAAWARLRELARTIANLLGQLQDFDPRVLAFRFDSPVGATPERTHLRNRSLCFAWRALKLAS